MSPQEFQSARIELGLSAEALGQLLGKTTRTIHRWEMHPEAKSARPPDPLACRVMRWLLADAVDLSIVRSLPVDGLHAAAGERHSVSGTFLASSGRRIATDRVIILDAENQMIFTHQGAAYTVEAITEAGEFMLSAPAQKPFFLQEEELVSRGWRLSIDET